MALNPVQRQQQYRARHPEKVRAYWRAHSKRITADPERRARRNLQQKARYYANLEASRARNRVYNSKSLLRRRYKLTFEQVDEMLRACHFLCVCGTRIDELTRRIDHDHKTGKVRGLLCNSCNHTLGLLRDDPIALRALADYLEQASGS